MNWLRHRLLDRASVPPRTPPEHEPHYYHAASQIAIAEARVRLLEYERRLAEFHEAAQREHENGCS